MSNNIRRECAADPEHVVWYQPIVAAASGRPLGAEARTRPFGVEGRLIGSGPSTAVEPWSPERLRRIDRETVRRVGATLAEWAAIGFVPSIALKVSTATIRRDAAGVLQWMADDRVDPLRVTVQIAETAPAGEAASVAAAVQRYRAAGLRVAIDAFGSGDTTFELLHRAGADVLKIGRRFLRVPASDERARRLVAALVRFAHDLGMQVAADGVESAEQWDWLTDIGCDAVQGGAIARPMAPDALVRWRERSAWRAESR